MSVKIRLQRYGRKQAPYYHIVVADSRAPRDGKFIENIGSYQPLTQPATIELNLDKAVKWLMNGAQPTETCRAILGYKGALYKKHLLVGVNKGALTLEQAEEKFAKWLEDKNNKVSAHVNRVADSAKQKADAVLAAEAKVNQDRAAKIAAKAAAAVLEAQTEETASEEAAPETDAPAEETTETSAE